MNVEAGWNPPRKTWNKTSLLNIRKKTQECGEENHISKRSKKTTYPYMHKAKKIEWYLYSGCSKHKTWDHNIFLFLKREKGGNFTFGNDISSKIIGKWMVSVGNEKEKKENLFLIEYMKHNLPIVIQMCDQGHILSFDSEKCEIRKKK